MGRETTRGFGRFHVSSAVGRGQFAEIVFQEASLQGLLNRLNPPRDSPDGGVTQVVEVEPMRQRVLRLSVTFRSHTTTFTKSGISGAVDVIPRVETHGSRAHVLIPATSIRGTLRSECERVMRTICGIELRLGEDHQVQLRAPLVDALFGIAGQGANVGDETITDVRSGTYSPISPLGKAMSTTIDLRGDLCSADDWAAIVSLAAAAKSGKKRQDEKNDLDLQVLLEKVEGRPVRHSHHVAIDRWTGGAADRFLFSVLEPMVETWKPWVITLDEVRLGESQLMPALALILCALQSIHEGAVGLGWGTHRGHGSVSIDEITIDSPTIGSITVRPSSSDIWSSLEAVDKEWLDRLRIAWAHYLADLETTS